MSSMTIDQLRKSLTEHGVPLPPPRSKKADYLKLYNQCTTINNSLGDVYSSDDENPPRNDSQNVTSSSSPSKSESIAREVGQLSDDELYFRLKQYDNNIGPVLKNTRRVYEKKLIKILTSGKQSNGYESVKQDDKFTPSVDEFSDSDVEVVSKSARGSESKSRQSRIQRDSPKPDFSESSKPDTERSFSSNYDYHNQSTSPGYMSDVKSSRYSYIETVPKGSSFNYIEQDTEGDYTFSDLRQRFTDKYDINKFSSDKYSGSRSTDDVYKPTIQVGDSYKPGVSHLFKSDLGGTDHYRSGFGSSSSSSQYKPGLGMSNQYKSGGRFAETYSGTWEPNISRYLNAGVQQKKVAVNERSHNYNAWLKNLLVALLFFVMLLLIIYICHQWSSTDPYKMIEDDAERKIQELSEGSGKF